MKAGILLIMFLTLPFLGLAVSDTTTDLKTRALKTDVIRHFYKVNLEFEKITGRNSWGVGLDYYHNISGYFSEVPVGIKGGVFVRHYFPKKWVNRFYLQGKLLCGFFSRLATEEFHDSYRQNDSIRFEETSRIKSISRFFTAGASLGFGVQLIVGRNPDFLIEPGLELQFLPLTGKKDVHHYRYFTSNSSGDYVLVNYDLADSYWGMETNIWHLIGPGSIILPSVKFGLLF